MPVIIVGAQHDNRGAGDVPGRTGRPDPLDGRVEDPRGD
ncbi:hypothetical protein Y013_22230 [Rhodococcus pyridinivorans SB3094]|uniref:Uncharacterized protein n=1 Tax=Rhodococcus pyridinivorans SB3094 TaxID=1435356 RepID=V9XRA4_9NOCA|nr:hypothetical protein Y013_22230 [Rhodococcus pyridinivorans SB3094]